jgi:hypothetical protein
VQRLFYACVPTPDSVPDMASFVTIAGRFGMLHREWGRQVGGAVQYRAGNFEAAIKRFTMSGFRKAPPTLPYDCFFLAMAHQRLGQAGEAKALLAKGVAWMEAADRQEGGSLGATRPGWDQWRERVTARALRAEAEALVRDAKGAPPK